ncbi:MAG: hypothetical protein ACR2NO_02800 [Chloroflexota bacterium]
MMILDILEDEGEQESDAFDARIAHEIGITAKTVRNQRGNLKNDGLDDVLAAAATAGAHPPRPTPPRPIPMPARPHGLHRPSDIGAPDASACPAGCSFVCGAFPGVGWQVGVAGGRAVSA